MDQTYLVLGYPASKRIASDCPVVMNDDRCIKESSKSNISSNSSGAMGVGESIAALPTSHISNLGDDIAVVVDRHGTELDHSNNHISNLCDDIAAELKRHGTELDHSKNHISNLREDAAADLERHGTKLDHCKNRISN